MTSMIIARAQANKRGHNEKEKEAEKIRRLAALENLIEPSVQGARYETAPIEISQLTSVTLRLT